MDPEIVYRGIGRLVVVDVTLDRGIDDPQSIFESLNSTGMDLSQSDLIRNFILMGLPEREQTRLYEAYWSKIENLFRGSEKIFDSFVRDYIALRTQASKQEKADQIYFAFRREYGSLGTEPEKLESFLKELLRFARYHAAFSIGSDPEGELHEPLARLRRLVDVPAILIMRLFDCYETQRSISVGQLAEAVGLVESYVFRRAIRGDQTRGYWQTFANLAYRIAPQRPLESLKVGLARLAKIYSFPNDHDFRKALEEQDIYQKRVCFELLHQLASLISKRFLKPLRREAVMSKKVEDDFKSLEYVFRQYDKLYEERGLVGVPLIAGQKRPALRNWQELASTTSQEREDRRNRFEKSHIGLLAGTPLSTNRSFCFVDVDHPGFVAFVKSILAPFVSGKFGSKGETIFVQAGASLKSAKLKLRGAKSYTVELFITGGMTAIPPSLHPSGRHYEWTGKPLLEIALKDLPILSEERFAIISAIAVNEHAMAIAEGGPGIKAHDHMLLLTSSGIALLTEDLEFLADSLNALFDPAYDGNTKSETLGMLQSAKEKGFGRKTRSIRPYDPGDQGPIPLGYAGSEFVFRNQQTKEVVRRSSVQLMMAAGLLELAPKMFWQSTFPKLNKDGVPIGIDWLAACDTLIQASRAAGVIDVANIRGIGLWSEDGRLLLNLGGEEIESPKYIYTSPKRLELIRADVPLDTILEFLSKPNWETPGAPQLLLGWALASICCGALSWRPHAGLTGAAQSGKSTILRGLGYILSPLALIKEGISTEAGIRQSIGYDARPVILDELEPESSRDRSRVERIVKLMRSSSGAVGSVARGTPEGKALNFSTSAMFLIAAINLYRISAADTSRLVKFELARHCEQQPRRNSAGVIALLRKLDGVGPAFCAMALDHAPDLLASIPLIHAELPVVQERQADNMATLLAGYWVALNRRSISAAEVMSFVEPFVSAVEEQREGVELDDATECLNVLLGTSVFVTQEDTNDEGATFTHKETMPLGLVIASVFNGVCSSGQLVAALDQHGVRIEDEGFLVANSHPGLDHIFRNTRWEGKLWGSALSRLEAAIRVPQRRFSDGVRSLATWIPCQYLPETP